MKNYTFNILFGVLCLVAMSQTATAADHYYDVETSYEVKVNGQRMMRTEGSGGTLVVLDGQCYVLAAKHATDTAMSKKGSKISVRKAQSKRGKTVKSRNVYRSDRMDLAVLKIRSCNADKAIQVDSEASMNFDQQIVFFGRNNRGELFESSGDLIHDQAEIAQYVRSQGFASSDVDLVLANNPRATVGHSGSAVFQGGSFLGIVIAIYSDVNTKTLNRSRHVVFLPTNEVKKEIASLIAKG